MPVNQLMTAEEARRFIMAGKATITFVSKTTGTRFTYKVQAPFKDDSNALDLNSQMRFVKVLTGQDNENSYSYLGYIRRSQAGDVFFHGNAKAKIGRDAPSVKAFDWAWRMLTQDKLPDVLEIWHEGHCGRCGRPLTVPDSIASGYGPECIEHINASWAA